MLRGGNLTYGWDGNWAQTVKTGWLSVLFLFTCRQNHQWSRSFRNLFSDLFIYQKLFSFTSTTNTWVKKKA